MYKLTTCCPHNLGSAVDVGVIFAILSIRLSMREYKEKIQGNRILIALPPPTFQEIIISFASHGPNQLPLPAIEASLELEIHSKNDVDIYFE